MSRPPVNTLSALRQKIAAMNDAHAAYVAAVREVDREIQHQIGAATIDKPDVAQIIDTVSEHFGTRPVVILGRVRTEEIARARMVAMVLVRKIKKMTTAETGRIFNRDHGTVIHAERAVSSLVQTVPAFAKQFEAIERNVRSRLAQNKQQQHTEAA